MDRQGWLGGLAFWEYHSMWQALKHPVRRKRDSGLHPREVMAGSLKPEVGAQEGAQKRNIGTVTLQLSDKQTMF